MGDVLIGVDLGTKTALFTARGEPVAEAFAATPLRWQGPGHVDQNPDDFYHATTRTIGGCLEWARIDPGRVAAIGIAGQMADVLGGDEAWQASMPYDSWLDQLCSPDVRDLERGIWLRDHSIKTRCLPGAVAAAAPA
jgi:xylulokinase